MKRIMNKIDKVLSISYAENTAINYRSDIEDFLQYLEHNNIKYDWITKSDIYGYIDQNKNLSSATLNRRLASISKMIDILELDIDISDIRIKKSESKKTKYLNKDEASRLICNIDNKRNKILIKTMITTGLRVSEVANIQVCDIDEQYIHVINGKGGKNRVVPHSLSADEISFLTKDKNDSDKLFGISDNMIYRIVKEETQRAGLKDISPHSLRHTFATLLLREGTDVATVSSLLGHSNISVTSRYLHSDEDVKVSAINKLAGAL